MIPNRFTTADGTPLAYEDTGAGDPVVWQHGLGGDRQQAAEVFPDSAGVRRITLECRGHGGSALGDPARLSIAQFATDIVSLLDHLGIQQAVFGGISMGAAISLRLAVTLPVRVKALVLARPAWVDAPAPWTMKPFLLVASLLKDYGPEEGLRRLNESGELAAVERISPDNAASLRGLFAREPESTLALMTRIPNDGPGVAQGEIAAIARPTLIIGNSEDYIHPLAYASSLQTFIPGATLRTITSKSIDKARHISQFRAALAAFLEHPGQ